MFSPFNLECFTPYPKYITTPINSNSMNSPHASRSAVANIKKFENIPIIGIIGTPGHLNEGGSHVFLIKQNVVIHTTHRTIEHISQISFSVLLPIEYITENPHNIDEHINIVKSTILKRGHLEFSYLFIIVPRHVKPYPTKQLSATASVRIA